MLKKQNKFFIFILSFFTIVLFNMNETQVSARDNYVQNNISTISYIDNSVLLSFEQLQEEITSKLTLVDNKYSYNPTVLWEIVDSYDFTAINDLFNLNYTSTTFYKMMIIQIESFEYVPQTTARASCNLNKVDNG